MNLFSENILFLVSHFNFFVCSVWWTKLGTPSAFYCTLNTHYRIVSYSLSRARITDRQTDGKAISLVRRLQRNSRLKAGTPLDFRSAGPGSFLIFSFHLPQKQVKKNSIVKIISTLGLHVRSNDEFTRRHRTSNNWVQSCCKSFCVQPLPLDAERDIFMGGWRGCKTQRP